MLKEMNHVDKILCLEQFFFVYTLVRDGPM